LLRAENIRFGSFRELGLESKYDGIVIVEMDLLALRDVAAAHPEVRVMYLFGSQADARTHPHSDVDIGLAVDASLVSQFERTTGKVYEIEMANEFGVVLGRHDVEVVTLHRVSPLFASRVIRGKCVFAVTEDERARIEERVILQWCDFRPFWVRMCEDVRARTLLLLEGRHAHKD